MVGSAHRVAVTIHPGFNIRIETTRPSLTLQPCPIYPRKLIHEHRRRQ